MITICYDRQDGRARGNESAVPSDASKTNSDRKYPVSSSDLSLLLGGNLCSAASVDSVSHEHGNGHWADTSWDLEVQLQIGMRQTK
jgi:hypothetical protein